MSKMTVADKLGTDKFTVDESGSHIIVDKSFADEQEIERLVRICPAALYKYENGELRFDYLGCLECGTCRVLSGGKAVTSWKYPVGAYGVTFRRS